ncbi:MAG: DinB family protein [Acidobacteriia bacterium]|nr:DinB family protein [Terriglobia bacterium]
MKLSESLLPELEHEAANTRKVLERVPEAKLAWKPHAKSFTMAALATHLAMIPGWGAFTLEQDSFDLEAPGAQQPPPPATSLQALLEMFDRNVATLRKALAAAEDARLLAPWSLKKGSQTIFTLPRIAVLRSMIMNHSIHHRAQLGVYLRLNDVPLPAIYGPSADEQA